MKTNYVTGEDLKAIGYPQGKSIGTALKIMGKQYSTLSKEEQLELLKKIAEAPEQFLDDKVLATLLSN